MEGMFENLELISDLNLSNYNTTNILYMINLFKNCHSLTSLNLSNFDTSKIK